MRRLLFVLGALAWSVVVFVVTFWATFPSDVLAERIRYEVPERSRDKYLLELAQVSPWWLGVTLSDVKLLAAPPPQRSFPVRPSTTRSANEEDGAPPALEGDEEEPEEEPEEPAGPTLVALLNSVSVRLDPLRSLLARSPHLSGSVVPTEGRIDFAVGTGPGKRDDITVTSLSVAGEDVPLADLAALGGASGDGKLDFQADLRPGENGMRDASGRAEVRGSGLTLSELEFPGMGPLGMDVPISELHVVLDVVSGRGTITEGRMVSELVTVGIAGEITLRDPLDRSAFDVTFTLSDLGESLAPFQGLMSSAKQADGTFQYNCRGVFSRVTPSACTTGRRTTTRPAGTGATGAAVSSRTRTETDEEKERHREEIRERLRQRREEREAQRAGSAPVATPGEPEGEEVDDLGDEPVLDDEEIPLEEIEEEPLE